MTQLPAFPWATLEDHDEDPTVWFYMMICSTISAADDCIQGDGPDAAKKIAKRMRRQLINSRDEMVPSISSVLNVEPQP